MIRCIYLRTFNIFIVHIRVFFIIIYNSGEVSDSYNNTLGQSYKQCLLKAIKKINKKIKTINKMKYIVYIYLYKRNFNHILENNTLALIDLINNIVEKLLSNKSHFNNIANNV